jgi:molecular chaperone GrpE
MTKSPDVAGPGGEPGPNVPFAAAGDQPAQTESGSGPEAEEGGADGELALDVEVEPPEPTLEQRIAELEAKQKETYDRYLRSVAELDNFRKRTRKEIEDARIDAQGRVLREMLPVIDNLERALSAAGGNEAGDGHSILEGVRLVLRQFVQALERCGVTPVPAQGAAFDPALHEAVSQRETAEAAPGTVVAVLQSGYRIGERLLRPALVVVAKAPPARAADPEPDAEGDGADGAAGGNGRDPDAA